MGQWLMARDAGIFHNRPAPTAFLSAIRRVSGVGQVVVGERVVSCRDWQAIAPLLAG